MRKQAFLEQLRKGLSSLPQAEIEERLTFYSEMIDDRMEEGLSEEDAVSAVGSVDEIAAQIAADIPPAKLVKEKSKPQQKLGAGIIVLLVLGAPLWLSLAAATLAVILSLYISLWSVIIALWAVFALLIGYALGSIAAGIGFSIGGNSLTGVAMIGTGIACTGLSIFTFFGCKAATKGTVWLTQKIAIGIKNCFVKKEDA